MYLKNKIKREVREIRGSEKLKTEREWKNIQTNNLLAPGRKQGVE